MTHIHIEVDGEVNRNAKVDALLNNVPLRDYIIWAIEEKVKREKNLLKPGVK